MDTKTLSAQVEAYCREQQIMGVLRVADRDEVLLRLAVGYADLSAKTPLRNDAVFTLYSLSKPFCAIGLLLLKDEGRVDLDAHPSDYVPEAADFDPRVKVRHLLRHTSGLPDFEQTSGFTDRFPPGPAEETRKQLRALSSYPSFFAPGTGDKYANVNFILSALIIENVSGLPYREYMRERVFAPLGMTTADVDSFEEPLPQQVKGYDLRDGTLIEVQKSRDWMLGAGDLVASADDVYALHRAIRDRSLLRPGTWDEVLTPDPINGMGMGCRVFSWHGHPCVMHNGGHTGFRTLHMQLLDGDLDVVFLSNCGFGDARSAVAELVWEAFSAPSASAPLPEMDKGYI